MTGGLSGIATLPEATIGTRPEAMTDTLTMTAMTGGTAMEGRSIWTSHSLCLSKEIACCCCCS